MGPHTGQLLCHGDMDESSHRANVYLLGMEYKPLSFVYEREPGPCHD